MRLVKSLIEARNLGVMEPEKLANMGGVEVGEKSDRGEESWGHRTRKVGRYGQNFEISRFDIVEVSQHECLRNLDGDFKKFRTRANFNCPGFDIAKFNCRWYIFLKFKPYLYLPSLTTYRILNRQPTHACMVYFYAKLFVL